FDAEGLRDVGELADLLRFQDFEVESLIAARGLFVRLNLFLSRARSTCGVIRAVAVDASSPFGPIGYGRGGCWPGPPDGLVGHRVRPLVWVSSLGRTSATGDFRCLAIRVRCRGVAPNASE